MKRLCVALMGAILALALPARAVLDDVSGGTITATRTCPDGVGMFTGGAATAAVTITGTFDATLTFNASTDGTNYVALYDNQTANGSTTSAGTYTFNVAGLPYICVGASAYASGTATVRIVASKAPITPPTVLAVVPGLDGATAAPLAAWGATGWAALTVVDEGSAARLSTNATGSAADDAAASGSPVRVGGRAVADGADPDDANAGDAVDLITDIERRLHVTTTHPNSIKCFVAASTATTVQAVGGSCATPGAGLSLHITDISFGSSAASGTAADSFPTLKSGTGGTCGAATTVVWGALGPANTTLVGNFTTPIILTAAHELCWIMTTAGTKVLTITGYIAP